MLGARGNTDSNGAPIAREGRGVDSITISEDGFLESVLNRQIIAEEMVFVKPIFNESADRQYLLGEIEQEIKSNIDRASIIKLSNVNLGDLLSRNILPILIHEYEAVVVWGDLSSTSVSSLSSGMLHSKTMELILEIDQEFIHAFGEPLNQTTKCYNKSQLISRINFASRGFSFSYPVGNSYVKLIEGLKKTENVNGLQIIIPRDKLNSTTIHQIRLRLEFLLGASVHVEVVQPTVSIGWCEATVGQLGGMTPMRLDVDWEYLDLLLKDGEEVVLFDKYMELIEMSEAIGWKLDKHESYEFLQTNTDPKVMLTSSWRGVTGFITIHVQGLACPSALNNICNEISPSLSNSDSSEVVYEYRRITSPKNVVAAFHNNERVMLQKNSTSKCRASVKQFRNTNGLQFVGRSCFETDESVGGLKGLRGI